jgi:hypothetical protein
VIGNILTCIAMKQPIHTDLLAEIAVYCDRHGIGKTTFGTAAVGDPSLVPDLEAGRELRSRTMARVRRYMAGGDRWVPKKAKDAAPEASR